MPDAVKQALKSRGWQDTSVVDRALALDSERRALITEHQQLQARNKRAAKAIGTLLRQREFAAAKVQTLAQAGLKEDAKQVSAQEEATQKALGELLLTIPNVPHASVPVGRTAADNTLVHECGARPEFEFDPHPHWELAARLGMVDFARGAKVTGAGFPFYYGNGAKLQRALVQFFLAEAESAGYFELQVPLLVNEDSVLGTGQLPDKERQMYHLRDDDLYLIPTAEVPLTNFYRDEIISEADLPLKVCGHTPCWRREAGSYGKDVRGLNRLHQFDKVEIVQIVHPERSYEVLEEMVLHAERLLEKLDLPYRRLLMCTGDMGFNQTKQYDLEVWSAGQKRWLEVSSVSNFGTYQSQRLKLRYRSPGEGKPRLAHTLNGSALALPRIVAAILENNQRADGSVKVPPSISRHAAMGDSWEICP